MIGFPFKFTVDCPPWQNKTFMLSCYIGNNFSVCKNNCNNIVALHSKQE